MNELERILNLAGLGHEQTDVAEESCNETKMVCKDCGDELGNPTTDCMNDSQDPEGDHWIEVDVDGDGDTDIKIARDFKPGMEESDVEEAVGDFADPILDLIDEVGSHQVVLDELIRYLDADTIEDFVADFRRHNDMGMEEAELEEDDLDENAFNQAAAAAARAGKPEFEFGGKKYKTKMDKDTAHKLDDDVQFEAAEEEQLEESSCGCCGNTPCDCADDCGCKESVNESPTMDTTQLITLLKNSGFTAEAIEEKLNEWANTPEGVGEVDPTDHGEAYEFAQNVNLSLKRYLDAQDMKVQVSEGHTVESMKEKYKNKK
jgi:hypothetical protein